MGKRRAKHPFEDNPAIDGFVEWMDAPEGQQSIEALDLVFDALAHAGVDARQRKIVWADGIRLSIEQSAERIHAGHLCRQPLLPCVDGSLRWCVPLGAKATISGTLIRAHQSVTPSRRISSSPTSLSWRSKPSPPSSR